MTVLDGKRDDNYSRTIGGTYANQVKRRIILGIAGNEMAGIGAIGRNVEKSWLIHRYSLAPHTPATDTMTADDSSDVKMVVFRQSSKCFLMFPPFRQTAARQPSPEGAVGHMPLRQAP
jgi:hypothetical protein